VNTPDRSRWDDRKVDHVRDYVGQATAPGVVAIIVGQEVQKVFMGYTRKCKTGSPQFRVFVLPPPVAIAITTRASI
jgi:hypothetical protein